MAAVLNWLWRRLGAIPPSEMGGIQLEGRYWEVPGRQVDPAAFLRLLPILVPSGATLVVEGGAHSPALAEILQKHAVAGDAQVARGTIWPRGSIYQLPVTTSVVEEVAAAAESCASPEVCDHLHVYVGQAVVLQWFDAFLDPFYVSQRVDRALAKEFCQQLGVAWDLAVKEGTS